MQVQEAGPRWVGESLHRRVHVPARTTAEPSCKVSSSLVFVLFIHIIIVFSSSSSLEVHGSPLYIRKNNCSIILNRVNFGFRQLFASRRYISLFFVNCVALFNALDIGQSLPYWEDSLHSNSKISLS